ncbi:MAG TPA: histidine kinase [Cyanobacteria bacterium UBA11372]|nr:histidine kinase [Cyanobacteria bacterium UBA11372]
MHSVAEYTEKLELANANLEKRVEERTKELYQKNSLLKQAHDELEIALKNLQQAQVQLIQAEKMSSLGQMVAGIAHEINNPVSFIYSNIEYANNYAQELLGLVELYQQQYPHPTAVIQAETEAIELDFIREDLPKILGSMKAGADRIRQIVLSLRNFSRLNESELKPANINEGIDSTLLIINNCFAGIELIKQYGDLPLVQCYPALLNQVFMNILNNAVDALKLKAANPTIWIRTEIVDNDRVKVRIRDNGPGISSEIKGKVFDPFFTTKDVGKGTGLGLTICYQIVEKHKGKIEISSELGQGTEIAIALPVK